MSKTNTTQLHALAKPDPEAERLAGMGGSYRLSKGGQTTLVSRTDTSDAFSRKAPLTDKDGSLVDTPATPGAEPAQA
ncbi:hypothetical protein [Polaromonas sp.]|uniref:hypothetical protein n=1 Tax=Polaromonas sp. TaxID=1869339 RepID=UPI0035629A08